MNALHRRLEKIAGQLGPKEAAFHLIDEAHRTPSFDAWWQEILRQESPRLGTLADQVAASARAGVSMQHGGRDRQAAQDRAARLAVRDLAFLYHLHWNANSLVTRLVPSYVLQATFLREQLEGLLLLEAVGHEMRWFREYLAIDAPYPLDPETAAAVRARIKYDVATWDDLGDQVREWVSAWYIDQGATELPWGAYTIRRELEEADGSLNANGTLASRLDAVRNAFSEREHYEQWKAGSDFRHGLADVPDVEYLAVCERVEQAIRDLARTGSLVQGTTVRLESVPHDFLQLAPLVEGQWIDRYVVELAEWGARLEAHGLQLVDDEDRHSLAWKRITQDRKEADAEITSALREEARANLVAFPGRTTETDGRIYLHIDDYRTWGDRSVRGGIPVAEGDGEGIVEASWNAWIEASSHGVTLEGKGATLAGIPVQPLTPYVRESDMLVLDRQGALAYRQTARRRIIDSLGEWMRRDECGGTREIHEGQPRWRAEMTSFRLRAEEWRAWARHSLSDVYAAHRTMETVRQRYFDGRPVLFDKEAEDLGQMMAYMEQMVSLHTEIVERHAMPELGLDLREVTRLAGVIFQDALRFLVDDSRADALRYIGERDAAREMIVSHWLDDPVSADSQ